MEEMAMKTYEKPMVLATEELAEGVYAASGAVEDEGACWTVTVELQQRVEANKIIYRVYAVHPKGLAHISNGTEIVIVFNKAIQEAYYDGGSAVISGNTLTLIREQHGNAYGEGDNFNAGVTIIADDVDTLSIVGTPTISCSKALNVQGGGEDEL